MLLKLRFKKTYSLVLDPEWVGFLNVGIPYWRARHRIILSNDVNVNDKGRKRWTHCVVRMLNPKSICSQIQSGV